jgi:adenosylcobinamide kinase/adenosylcobinamide-phosphate guanylyltransferase
MKDEHPSALTLLIGGARSGKSRLATEHANKWSGPVTFIATAEGRDEEMAARIARHREERDEAWSTVEEAIEIAVALSKTPAEELIILDCLTLWVSNLLDRGFDPRDAEALAREASSIAAARANPVVVITNEVGAGIVPDNAAARAYRDLLGTINSIFAADAKHVLYVAAGHVVSMKRPEEVIDDVLDR